MTRHRAAAILLASLGAACARAQAPAAAPAAALSAAQPARVYVANQENASLTVIDGASRAVVRTIDLTTLGYTANCKPHHVAVEPDGSFYYVSLIGDGRVVKFDRADRVVAEARTLVPGMIALVPGGRLVVGRSMSAVNPPASVAVIDRSTMQVIEEVDVPFPRPHAVAVDPEGAWAYTASLSQNQMAAINLPTLDVRVLPIDGPLHTIVQFALSADGRWLVGSGQLSGRFLVWDLEQQAAPRLVASLPVGGSPWDPVFAPDQRSVWLANLDSNTVTVVDAREWRVAAVIRDGRLAQPNGLALTPDGRTAYVSNRNQHGPAHHHDALPGAGIGFVAVIDAATRTVTGILPAGRYAAGVGAPAAATSR